MHVLPSHFICICYTCTFNSYKVHFILEGLSYLGFLRVLRFVWVNIKNIFLQCRGHKWSSCSFISSLKLDEHTLCFAGLLLVFNVHWQKAIMLLPFGGIYSHSEVCCLHVHMSMWFWWLKVQILHLVCDNRFILVLLVGLLIKWTYSNEYSSSNRMKRRCKAVMH